MPQVYIYQEHRRCGVALKIVVYDTCEEESQTDLEILRSRGRCRERERERRLERVLSLKFSPRADENMFSLSCAGVSLPVALVAPAFGVTCFSTREELLCTVGTFALSQTVLVYFFLLLPN